jgi:hypothetical protein
VTICWTDTFLHLRNIQIFTLSICDDLSDTVEIRNELVICVEKVASVIEKKTMILTQSLTTSIHNGHYNPISSECGNIH